MAKKKPKRYQTVPFGAFFSLKMAERGGFEPPVRCYSYDGLANRYFRPLSHLSGFLSHWEYYTAICILFKLPFLFEQRKARKGTKIF